uniref:ELFN1/ELFN2 fibronectin type-III domain-containing protein n=1 Tax=Eptatretus burgeri TaxID=7764 RepID=A0A8C4NC52_EPTBU
MFKFFSRPPATSALERLSLTCPTPVTSPNPVTSPSPPEATPSSTPGFMPVVPMIGRSPDVPEEENNCLPGRCFTDEKFMDRVMPTAPHPSLELKSVSLKGATLLARIPRPLERFFVLSRYNSGNCIKLRKLSRTFESIPVSDISSEGFTTFCIASVKRSHCLNHTCLKFNSSGAVWPHSSGLGLQISPGEASEEARGQAFFGWGWGNGLAMVAGVVMLVVMLSCVIWRSRRKGDGHDGGASGIGVMGDRSGTDMTNISATEEEDGVLSKEEEMPTRPQMKSLTPPQRPPPYPLSPSTKFTSHTPVTSPMPAVATGGYVEVSGHSNMASGIESLKSVPHQVEAGITVSSLFSAVPSRTIITSEGSLSPSAQSESGTSQVIMASPPHVMLGKNKGSFGIPATLATTKEPGLDTKDAASLFVDTTPTNRTPFCGAPQIAAISQEVDRVNVIISSCIDALRGSNSSSSGGSGLAGTGSETTVSVPHTSSAPHGFMLLRAEELAALARGPMSQTCSAHPSTSRSVAVPSNTSKIQHNLHLTRGFTSVPDSAVSLLPAHSSSSSCLPPCRPPRTPPLLWRDDSQTSLSHPPITHPIEVHPPTAHYHLAQSPSSALPVQALQPSFSPSSPETPSARRAARALWRKLQRVRGRARRDDTRMQVVSKGAGHALKEKVQRARGEDLHEILDYWKGVSAQHT